MATMPVTTKLLTHIRPRNEDMHICLACMKRRTHDVWWEGNMKCYKCQNCGTITKVWVEPYGKNSAADAQYDGRLQNA